MDILKQVLERRLVEVLEQERYARLDRTDIQRILETVDEVLDASSIAQGARELVQQLEVGPEIDAKSDSVPDSDPLQSFL